MTSWERGVTAGSAAALPSSPASLAPVHVDAELVVEVLERLVGAEGETDVAAAGLPPLLRLAGVRAVAVVARRHSSVVVLGSAGYDCSTMAPGALLPLESGLPVTEAVRHGRPVVQGRGPSWVAVPFPGPLAGALLLSLDAAPPQTAVEMWRLHRVSRGIGDALHRAREQERLAADLAVVTARFTARQAPTPGWDVAVRSLPHRGAFAGDTVVCSADGRGGLWLLVADACGAGAAAALVARSVHATVTALTAYADGPADLLRAADAALRPLADDEGFVTALAARLVDGTLEVASAGHPPPVVLTSDGPRVVTVEPGPPLALADHPPGACPQASFRLGADDALLLHTDGLLDRRYAGRPLAAELGALVEGVGLTSVDAVADRVLDAASAAGDPGDDVSLVVARRSR